MKVVSNTSVLIGLGILIWARKTGKIETLREYLDALRSRGKFRFSHELYKRALIEAGELESTTIP